MTKQTVSLPCFIPELNLRYSFSIFLYNGLWFEFCKYTDCLINQLCMCVAKNIGYWNFVILVNGIVFQLETNFDALQEIYKIRELYRNVSLYINSGKT